MLGMFLLILLGFRFQTCLKIVSFFFKQQPAGLPICLGGGVLRFQVVILLAFGFKIGLQRYVLILQMQESGLPFGFRCAQFGLHFL